jgi:riboflavin kinase/FMN adenylyltransferase
MRIYRHFNALPAAARGSAVAVGNFDGVHLGHRAVVTEAGRIARAFGMPWAALTFEPHPRRFFQPALPPFRLTPFRAKAREIAALGVDHMVVLRFDRKLSERPAESFVTEVLVEGLGARHVVSGYDFAFGHKRRGDCALLLAMGRRLGFDFTAVHPMGDDSGEPYSSTRVRQALQDGDPRAAARLLGRPFEIEGRVVAGDGRGRAIGFPTANVNLGEFLCPKFGVYAVRVAIEEPPPGNGARWRGAVANLGIRPMFALPRPILEAHVFDFQGDVYGRRVRVGFVDYLRPEMAFDGLASLQAQMEKDGERARRLLAEA